MADAVRQGDLVAAAVLSGNRNFEGRVNPLVKANYLASPPLVVAYALAGTTDIDLTTEPLGQDRNGRDVYLREIWPTRDEIDEAIRKSVLPEMFSAQYQSAFESNPRWNAIQVSGGELYDWDESSTYIQEPPFLIDLPVDPLPIQSIRGARVLALLGDSVTTDHISPAGSIAKDSPAGKYLMEHGVAPEDFNSYGSRRGNDRVMLRGTFANIRIRNQLAPGTEGGWTRHLPGRRDDDDLRCGDEVQARAGAADRPGWTGVRDGQQSRLGRQRDVLAGCACGDRRELRANSPQQPGRDGRAALAVPARPDLAIARTDRRRDIRDSSGRTVAAAWYVDRDGDVAGRSADDVSRRRCESTLRSKWITIATEGFYRRSYGSFSSPKRGTPTCQSRLRSFPLPGRGTRLIPLTKSQPKEMLPLGRKPTVQHVVEELFRSGIGEMLFVTGPGKQAIENHFDIDEEMVQHLRTTGKEDLLADLDFERQKIEYFYTRQRRQLGLGHAVLCAKPFVGQRPFLVALGDSLIGLNSRSDVCRRMIDTFDREGVDAVIAFQKVPREEVVHYGIAQPRSTGNGRRRCL